MSSSRHRSAARPLTGLLAAAVGLLLAACGGDAGEADAPTSLGAQRSAVEPVAPSEDAAATTEAPEPPADDEESTSAPDAEAGATTTTPPAPPPPADEDRWEDDARVEVVSVWAEEYARAATAGDPDREEWLETMTGAALEDRMLLIEPDLGWTYPGPVPFTVTQVVDRDGGAAVEACVMAAGFALDPATGSAPEQVLVYPMEFHLEVEGEGDDEDDYVIDGIYQGNQSCDGIDIKGSAW